MTLIPKGIIPAMVTPFGKDEELDEDVAREVVRHLMRGGVHGIFVSGSQGEFWALNKEEKRRLFEIAVDEVNGKMPVYAGTGAVSTREVIELTEMANDVGVDAASIITPYYIKPNSSELVEHFETVAEKTDLPILLYFNPGRTGGLVLEPISVAALVEEHSNIVGVKDSSGDLTLTLQYIRECGDKISILAGRDTLIYATLVYGGKGAITATANVFPELLVDIYESFMRGDHEKAYKAQSRLTPLRIAFSLGSFPVVVKEAMSMIGLKVGPCRKPIKSLPPKNADELRRILSSFGPI